MSAASFVSDALKQSAEPLMGLAAAGLTWLCAWASRWFYVHAKNERVKGILVRLNDAAATAVGEMEQSAVKALKAASPDGKLTPATAAAVKDAAITSLKGHLGPKGLEELKTVLGVADVEAALSSRIESAVKALTASVPAAVPPGGGAAPTKA